MKPITPHLWFDKEAKEAAQFYCSVFPNSKITNVTTLRDTPGGDCDVVAFELNGQPFMAISAGPLFKFNESISFMVYCDTQAEIDKYWAALSAVPSAEQCGWLKDKYGLSWQIVPARLYELMTDADPARAEAASRAMLGMRRIVVAELEAAGAHVYIPRQDQDYAVTAGLRALVERHLATSDDGLYAADPAELPLLRYYANSIAHLEAAAANPRPAAA